MKTEMILNYEAPQVEVIEVEVEKGFAGSIDVDDQNLAGFNGGGGY